MSILEVDASRVTSAASTASTSADTLASEVDALMRHLNALGECWKGSAAQNFQAVIHEWEGVQRQVHTSLQSIREALHHAGRQYAEVEETNTRLFAN